MEQVKKIIAEVLNEAAEVIATGKALKNIRVGVTLLGSEHGVAEVLQGAEIAARNLPGVEVVVIGPEVETNLSKVVVADEKEGHKTMEKMLDSGELQAAVTMHYNFPIGTSTVGLVVTPARGRKMFIATTTGTSSADRVEGMVKNAVYGIAAAKAYGIKQPKLGILNVDGARQVERILKELQKRGYEISFTESKRTDGGVVMRGNDLLAGTPDVMVCDSLTGNLLMKIFSAYTTGGSYEALGYGYGPGIGEGFTKIINIISRASGAPVIAGAIEYASLMAQGKLVEIAQSEITKAKKAGLLELAKPAEKKDTVDEEVKMPPKKPVDKEIAGIDVLELENAQKLLWKHGIYAETGMGCTGPIVLVAPDDISFALKVLKENKVL